MDFSLNTQILTLVFTICTAGIFPILGYYIKHTIKDMTVNNQEYKELMQDKVIPAIENLNELNDCVKHLNKQVNSLASELDAKTSDLKDTINSDYRHIQKLDKSIRKLEKRVTTIEEKIIKGGTNNGI